MKMWSLTIVSAATLSIAFAASQAVGQTVLLSDNMSTGTGWTYSHLGGTAQPTGGDNQSADFGFDYSAFGIPEAPNSDAGDPATQGLRMADNLNGFFNGVGVAAVYEDVNFDDQYTIQVDAWLNWAPIAGNIGTTEYAGVYAGFNTTDAQSSGFPAQDGAGVTLNGDGDCGNCDYILDKDFAELDLASGQYSVTEYTASSDPPPNQVTNSQGINDDAVNTNPALGELIDFPATFPELDIAAATGGLNATGTQQAGAAGFRWLTITAEVDANAVGNGTNGSLGTAKFTIENTNTGESVIIGTVDNSVDDDPGDGISTGEAPVGMEGAIALIMIDFFSGAPNVQAHGFSLFDNVRVFDGFLVANDPDVDGDGDVDGKDFLEIQRTDPSLIPDWEADFGNGVGPLAGVGAVPEPTTALLMALGAALMVARRQ